MGTGDQRHTPDVLPSGKTRYPLYRRLGGPKAGVDACRKSHPSPGFDPRTVQPVASRYTDWTIPAHCTVQQGNIKHAVSICIIMTGTQLYHCNIVAKTERISHNKKGFYWHCESQKISRVIARVATLRAYERADRKVKRPTQRAIKSWLQKVHLLQSVQYPSKIPTENFDKSHLQR
jgi:hypothetical protein